MRAKVLDNPIVFSKKETYGRQQSLKDHYVYSTKGNIRWIKKIFKRWKKNNRLLEISKIDYNRFSQVQIGVKRFTCFHLVIFVYIKKTLYGIQ